MDLKDVLLGLVRLSPGVSGYDLKKIITGSTGYFVSASLSQIYPSLKQLTEDGLLTFESVPLQGRPAMKKYQITNQGIDHLTEVLKQTWELPQSMSAFRDFLLQLTFMGLVEDEDVVVYTSAGLRHFEAERERILENSLAQERSFIHLEGAERDRSVKLWELEYEFLIEDIERKIAWIQMLIAEFS